MSADGRYGPIFNLGLAEAVGKRLVARGYVVGSGDRPADRLQRRRAGFRRLRALFETVARRSDHDHLDWRCDLSDAGLASTDHLYHLRAPGLDAGIGGVFFVGRWPFLKYCTGTRRHEGRVTIIPTAPMGHMAEAGPFVHRTSTTRLHRGRPDQRDPDAEHAQPSTERPATSYDDACARFDAAAQTPKRRSGRRLRA